MTHKTTCRRVPQNLHLGRPFPHHHSHSSHPLLEPIWKLRPSNHSFIKNISFIGISQNPDKLFTTLL
ncbi:hypothetical protein TorRG33x02_175500 [Trema orientale]|uniref:Uncharacterized protein n=1 Tax=Trema orientale TaxID=63057 RepID=A0A2P5EMB6_TREOI|nr:hypothetical protein TorRG33x02_175500 [Trema orientale]